MIFSLLHKCCTFVNIIIFKYFSLKQSTCLVCSSYEFLIFAQLVLWLIYLYAFMRLNNFNYYTTWNCSTLCCIWCTDTISNESSNLVRYELGNHFSHQVRLLAPVTCYYLCNPHLKLLHHIITPSTSIGLDRIVLCCINIADWQRGKILIFLRRNIGLRDYFIIVLWIILLCTKLAFIFLLEICLNIQVAVIGCPNTTVPWLIMGKHTIVKNANLFSKLSLITHPIVARTDSL